MVNRKRWRLVTIEAERAGPDGTADTWEVQTLQRRRWLRRLDVDAGETLPLSRVLDLADMGAPEGLVGVVKSIGPTPQLDAGPGRVVLTTINHLNDFVFDLSLTDATEKTGQVRFH